METNFNNFIPSSPSSPSSSSSSEPLSPDAKSIQKRNANGQPKSGDTLMLDGNPVSLKDIKLYLIQQENQQGNMLVLLHKDHAYFSEEHEEQLNKAAAQGTLDPELMQIYQTKNPENADSDSSASSETCWHALDASIFQSITDKLPPSTQTIQNSLSQSVKQKPRSSKHHAPTAASPSRRKKPTPKSQEQEDATPQQAAPGAPAQSFLGGVLETMKGVDAHTKQWMTEQEVTSYESNIETRHDDARKEDWEVGVYQNVPLNVDSQSSQSKEEKEKEGSVNPPPSSAEQQKQIEIMRSQLSA